MKARNSSIGRPPMGWAPAVFGRFLKPGGLGGRPKLALALPTMPAWIRVAGVERDLETRGATGRDVVDAAAQFRGTAGIIDADEQRLAVARGLNHCGRRRLAAGQVPGHLLRFTHPHSSPKLREFP